MMLVAVQHTATRCAQTICMGKTRPLTGDSLARNLRHLMDLFGFTQAELARRSGVSQRHPQRLWIEPTPGRGMALVLNGRQDRWAAMRPEIEPVYRAAAVTFLTGEHPACAIDSGTPYPDALAFEFTYSCP